MWITALIVGGMIGLAFGMIQTLALRRNERLQLHGKLKSGWSVMPGSGARVAYLLVALALVQFICPLLFANGTQWLVSAGVVGGYAVMLTRQLRQKMAESR